MKYLYKDKIWYSKSKTDSRRWLHCGDTTWRFEGYLGKKANHTMIGADLGGDENDILFKLGIKRLFSVYFGVEDLLPRKLMHKLFGYDGRIYELSLSEEYFTLDFHRDDYGYSEGWKGIHWMFNWKEFLYGKWEYKSEIIDNKRILVPMPEGNYPATVEIKKVSRGYKRSKKQLTSNYQIDLDIPIPYEGKGENGWDCEEDGTYSSNIMANSLEEAIQNLVDSSLKYRVRYGGENWKPNNGWEVQKL